jgi:hypothetical protein
MQSLIASLMLSAAAWGQIGPPVGVLPPTTLEISGRLVILGLPQSNPGPLAGVPITCDTGQVAFTAFRAPVASQEVEILSVPANTRWEQITVCETTKFAGRNIVTITVAMRQPATPIGTPYAALMAMPLGQSSNNIGCWNARPAPFVSWGPYSVVLNFTASPGTLNLLTDGLLTWEVCRYPGLIGR